jgi:hypothetical protein
MNDKLQEIFDGMPNSRSIDVWDHERSIGFSVNWSEKGRGFGEYDFYIDKKDGKLKIGNECDGKGAIQKVLYRMVDENPNEVKKLFDTMPKVLFDIMVKAMFDAILEHGELTDPV